MDLKAEILKYLNNPQSLERLGHCATCPSFQKDIMMCKECGCMMKLKVLVPTATCPLGKW
jgi:hypothetical protein